MSAKKGKTGKGGGTKSRGSSSGTGSSTRNEEKRSASKEAAKRVPKTGKCDAGRDDSDGGGTH